MHVWKLFSWFTVITIHNLSKLSLTGSVSINHVYFYKLKIQLLILFLSVSLSPSVCLCVHMCACVCVCRCLCVCAHIHTRHTSVDQSTTCGGISFLPLHGFWDQRWVIRIGSKYHYLLSHFSTLWLSFLFTNNLLILIFSINIWSPH